MSRTIRFRKTNHIPWWADYEWKNWQEITEEEFFSTKYDRKLYSSNWRSKVLYEKKVETKTTFWKIHRDQKFGCKEPGPSWFRNLTSERPQRREGKRQLDKFLLDPDFEVLLDGKVHLEYYT